MTRFSVDEWKLMRRAGLAQVAQGADTGSPKVMKLMNKTFQKLETIHEAAEMLHRGRRAAVVQHDFRVSRREREAEQRESDPADHGYLPALSRRGVLDQHFHAVSGRAGDGTCVRAGHPRAEKARRVGGFLSALYGAAVAQRTRARAAADHARVSAMAFTRVPVSIHRKDRFTRARPQCSPSRRAGGWITTSTVPFEMWLNQAARRVFKPLKPKVDAQQLSSEPVTC